MQIITLSENCEWNGWKISECSKTCGGGTRTKSRSKKKEESNGGVCTGESILNEKCKTQKCPGKVNWDVGYSGRGPL